MKRILVGVDGTAASGSALAWAAALAAATGAELVTATVVPDGTPGAAAREDPAVSGRHLTLVGDECELLERTFAEESADLMVIGSPAGEWFPALHLGQTAHRLASRSGHPIAIVPAGSDAVVAELVLGLDGSPGSRAALRWVAGLPPALTGRVVVVHAVPGPPAPFLHAPGVAVGEGDVREWIHPLTQVGIEVTVPAVGTDPVDALTGQAGRRGAVVVIGGRPVDPSHPLALGSVARRVLDRCTGPVVVVPPTD